MSIDPIRTVRILPALPARRIGRKRDDREQEPQERRSAWDEPTGEDEESTPDDGLPHVDIRT